MENRFQASSKNRNIFPNNGIKLSIATKLTLSFTLVIILISAFFIVVGSLIIDNYVVRNTREKVRRDLDTARELYINRLSNMKGVISSTANEKYIKDSILAANMNPAIDGLVGIRLRERFDVLTVTDEAGNVLLRTSNLEQTGDNVSHDELVGAVLKKNEAIAATTIISSDDLLKSSPQTANDASVQCSDPNRPAGFEINDGMMMKAAAPILDNDNNLIGIIYSGVLLNRNLEYVDQIKRSLYQNLRYNAKDIGIASIFLNGIGISTSGTNIDGSRAIGTCVDEDIFTDVVIEGRRWIGYESIANNTYIVGYEPLKNLNHEPVGMLQVGVLEEMYLDIKNQTTVAFLAITLAGALVAILFSYYISRRISVPINKLVAASRELAAGNLDAKVDFKSQSNDELEELAVAFNTMATKLKERDEKLKDYTRKKIMESERLALIGQLSANVAHELNNPLTGIVTYSHLLLERMSEEHQSIGAVEKIISQADRCKDIIRGLLDFARQRKPDKILTNVNIVLQECVSLVEYQALFHNIEITKDFQADLPLAKIDPSQIERVFMNIIINAAEAMDGDGQLNIATRYDTRDQFIEISFADTGSGIDEENLESIFDPFFTTKEIGHGTGLGLAISYGIIKEHNGIIAVQSEKGKGTTFYVRIPVMGKKRG
jgi:two-component system NtrC family sensor kinase